MSYGIIYFAAVIFLAVYALRKRSYSYRAGTRQDWLQAHVYIGILSAVLLFMHMGIKPTGTFSIFMSILFFLVIISGITGSLIYSRVPLSLTKYGRTVKSEEEIAASISGCLEEADTLVSGMSGEFQKLYHRKIRPFMAAGKTKWFYLLMTERELLDNRRKVIEQCKSLVHGHDMSDLNVLSSILIEKEKLSFMQAKLKLQNAWLNFHMPLTMALLAASAVHIVTILYY